MVKTAPKSVGIYARISNDPKGLEAGVDRQVADCYALCKRKGWPVAGEYIDNDFSASSYARRPRPEYERLMGDLASGVIGGIVVYSSDRLVRQTRELEDVIDLVHDSGALLANVRGEVDLTSSEGRLFARMMGVFAASESEKMSERVKRAKQALVDEGLPQMSGFRPFGYADDRMTIVPTEARIIRNAYERCMAGETVYGIQQAWKAEGVLSTADKNWSYQGIKRLLQSPRIAGLREHNGTVVGDAAWKGIITPEQHESIKALFASRSTNQVPQFNATHLLSGLMVCGKCGAKMYANTVKRANGNQIQYRCKGDRSEPGQKCSISIDAIASDEYIRAVVILALVSRPSEPLSTAMNSGEVETDDISWAAQVTQLRTQVEKVENDFYIDQSMTEEAFKRLHPKLTERLSEARANLMSTVAFDTIGQLPLTEDELEQLWDQKGVAWQRALISATLRDLVVGPSEKKGRYPSPPAERISYELNG